MDASRSVVFWSLCNEQGCNNSPDSPQPYAAAFAAQVKDEIELLDSSRPVTAAMSSDFGEGTSVALDVQGINCARRALACKQLCVGPVCIAMAPCLAHRWRCWQTTTACSMPSTPRTHWFRSLTRRPRRAPAREACTTRPPGTSRSTTAWRPAAWAARHSSRNVESTPGCPIVWANFRPQCE